MDDSPYPEARDQQPAHPPSPPQPRESVGSRPLTLAIVSLLFLPWVMAVVALVQAARDARRLRESPVPLEGAGRIKAARIVATTSLVIWVLVAPVVVALAVGQLLGDDGGAATGLPVDRFAEVELRGVGICFDNPDRPRVVECTGPHDAEFIGSADLRQ